MRCEDPCKVNWALGYVKSKLKKKVTNILFFSWMVSSIVDNVFISEQILIKFS